MTGNENIRRPMPEETAQAKSTFFRDYFIIPGEEDPTSQVGVIELNVPDVVLDRWKEELRSCLRKHNPGSLYSSMSPDLRTKTREFIVKPKKDGGASVQLRGLSGLKTPVTLVVKDKARVYFPIHFRGLQEDVKAVIEQLGPDYWTKLPKHVKDYHTRQVRS